MKHQSGVTNYNPGISQACHKECQFHQLTIGLMYFKSNFYVQIAWKICQQMKVLCLNIEKIKIKKQLAIGRS